MAKRYSIAEARANLPAIVDQADIGKEIEITRRGKSVAVVISLRKFASLTGERVHFADAYKQFLEKHPLGEAGVDAADFKSTRDLITGRKVQV